VKHEENVEVDPSCFTKNDESPQPVAMNVVAWGFWSRETAASFASAVLDVCKKAPIGTCLALLRFEGSPGDTVLAGVPSDVGWTF
jgi:hypothetical protein